eukprot:20034-Heterococcus_DN1.PRE.5
MKLYIAGLFSDICVHELIPYHRLALDDEGKVAILYAGTGSAADLVIVAAAAIGSCSDRLTHHNKQQKRLDDVSMHEFAVTTVRSFQLACLLICMTPRQQQPAQSKQCLLLSATKIYIPLPVRVLRKGLTVKGHISFGYTRGSISTISGSV